MGILLYLYPNGYTTIPIPKWVYYYTYTLMGTIPIPLWVYYYTYTQMGIVLYLHLEGILLITSMSH